MSEWPALGAFYAIALAIAAGVMVYAARVQAARPETRRVLPEMFPWLDERRTYANAVSIARYARHRPTAWMVVVFAAAPTIAALVVAPFGNDVADLGSLLARLALWHDVDTRGALVTYGVVLVVFVVVSAVYLRVARAAPDDQTPALLRGRSDAQVWPRLLGGTVVDEGGTLEELGWRGFALPVAVVATGSLWWATLLLAVAWWAWHLPREVPGLRRRPDWRRFAVLQGQFVVLCVALSALMTVAWRLTGSVWPAILIHGGSNVWSKALGGPMWARTGRDVRTLIIVALAVVVVAVDAAR